MPPARSPSSSPPPPPPDVGSRPDARPWMVALGIAATLAVASIAAVAAWWTSRDARPASDPGTVAEGIDFGFIDGASPPSPAPVEPDRADAAADPQAAADDPARADDPAHDPAAAGHAAAATPPVVEQPPAVPAEPPQLVAIAALPVAAVGALEGGRGDAATVVDLGACGDAAARGLALELAVPADAVGRLALERVAVEPPRWAVRWTGGDSGLEGDAAAVAATIEAAGGRLRMSLPAGAARLPARVALARAVVLVRPAGGGGPHEIRFVNPVGIGGVGVDLLGKRLARLPLRLPPGVTPADLQRGGCRIDVDVAGTTHVLDVAAGGEPRPVTMTCPVLALPQGGGFGLVVELDPQRTTLTIRPEAAGPGGRGDWLGGLAGLVEGGDRAAQKCVAGWQERVNGVAGLGLDAAVSKWAGDRIDALFQESLLLPGGLAPMAESLQAAFDRHLRNAGRQPEPNDRGIVGPTSFDAWRRECLEILAEARQGGPMVNPDTLRNRWNTTFTRPLQQWWAAYRLEAEAAVDRLAADVTAARARAKAVRVLRVVAVARAPGGGEYDVPLARFDETPPAGDDPLGQYAPGLDDL